MIIAVIAGGKRGKAKEKNIYQFSIEKKKHSIRFDNPNNPNNLNNPNNPNNNKFEYM